MFTISILSSILHPIKAIQKRKEYLESDDYLQKKYSKKISKIQYKNKVLEHKLSLHQLKKTKPKKITTSKLVLYLILASCFLVGGWSIVMMTIMRDLSYMYLIATPLLTSTLSYSQYAYKAMKENTEGGITHDSALQQNQEDDSQG